MKLSWSITQRKSGRPFNVATDVDHYDLAMKVEGAPDFTPIAGPAPTATDFTVDVTDPGLYTFRLVCFPKTGAASDPVEASAEILDQTAPVIVNFNVVVSI